MQGCSVSPVVFRRFMEDMFAEVGEDWRRRGCGVSLGDERLQYVCGADDTWLFTTSAANLSYMVQISENVTKIMVGMKLCAPKSTGQVQRQGHSMLEFRAS